MKQNKIEIKNSKNERIVGVWHLPENKTKKVIILAHGITVDKDEGGIFVKLANKLCESGFAVFRFDFRAHGESDGKPIDFNVDWEVEDLTTVVKYVKSEGYRELGLLGASFGGGSSVIYSANHLDEKIKALCLWNPVLNYDHTFINPTLPWIKDKVGNMQEEIEKKGFTTLGSAKYVLGQAIFDSMKNNFPHKEISKIKIPTIIIHGTKDTKVPYEDSVEYSKLLIKGEFVTIENAEHGFHEDNEYTEAEKITAEFFKKYL